GHRTRLRLLRGEPARFRGGDGTLASRRATEAAPRRPPAAASPAAPLPAGGRRGPAELESLRAVLTVPGSYQPRRSTGHDSSTCSPSTPCSREWWARVGSTCAGHSRMRSPGCTAVV